MEKPDFVFENTPFKVIVPSPNGAFIFEHLKPVSHLALRNDKRKRDEFYSDIEAAVKWITGGPDGMRSHETDIYGVVQLQIEDISNQIIDMAALADKGTEDSQKKAQAEFKALRDAHLQRAKGALDRARDIADARVKRALRVTHQNLIKQWEIMQQDGKGRYSPSIAEAVGAHILSSEIDKASEKKKEMVDRFVQIAKNTVIT